MSLVITFSIYSTPIEVKIALVTLLSNVVVLTDPFRQISGRTIFFLKSVGRGRCFMSGISRDTSSVNGSFKFVLNARLEDERRRPNVANSAVGFEKVADTLGIPSLI